MLGSRCLLLRCSCNLEHLFFSCKYANYREFNIIRCINAENEYLYGKLLESQKQRRKGLSKLLTTSPKSNKKVVIEDDLDDDTLNPKNEALSKPRIKRSKINKILTSDCTANSSMSNSLLSVELVNNPLDLENKSSNEDISKKRSKKVKATEKTEDLRSLPSAGINEIIVKATKAASVSTREFVFSSPVVVNDINYPLENKLKLLADSSNTEKVLCYGFSDPAIKQYIKFPSVSKIIEETMSNKNKLILSKWRQNMIRDLGEDGFNKYSEGSTRRVVISKSRELTRSLEFPYRQNTFWRDRRSMLQYLKTRGQEFHSAVRNTVLGKPTEKCSQVSQNAIKSLSWMLEHVSSPMAVESIIAHPLLGYKGIPDCVALFRNIPVVIDWKLSEKPKKELKDTFEAPVQITAYMGALNHDPNYKWGVNHGLVAVAYDSGDPCDVFLLAPKHCEIYWRHWLMRFDKFKARSHLHLDHNIDEKSLKFT